MDEPEVVEALPIETSVSLPVTSSFYEDVKAELHFDPEVSKQLTERFDAELSAALTELQGKTRLYLSPPSVTNRAPQRRAVEE